MAIQAITQRIPRSYKNLASQGDLQGTIMFPFQVMCPLSNPGGLSCLVRDCEITQPYTHHFRLKVIGSYRGLSTYPVCCGIANKYHPHQPTSTSWDGLGWSDVISIFWIRDEERTTEQPGLAACLTPQIMRKSINIQYFSMANGDFAFPPVFTLLTQLDRRRLWRREILCSAWKERCRAPTLPGALRRQGDRASVIKLGYQMSHYGCMHSWRIIVLEVQFQL